MGDMQTEFEKLLEELLNSSQKTDAQVTQLKEKVAEAFKKIELQQGEHLSTQALDTLDTYLKTADPSWNSIAEQSKKARMLAEQRTQQQEIVNQELIEQEQLNQQTQLENQERQMHINDMKKGIVALLAIEAIDPVTRQQLMGELQQLDNILKNPGSVDKVSFEKTWQRLKKMVSDLRAVFNVQVAPDQAVQVQDDGTPISVETQNMNPTQRPTSAPATATTSAQPVSGAMTVPTQNNSPFRLNLTPSNSFQVQGNVKQLEEYLKQKYGSSAVQVLQANGKVTLRAPISLTEIEALKKTLTSLKPIFTASNPAAAAAEKGVKAAKSIFEIPKLIPPGSEKK
ncbi:MAG: hypothetical protein ACD_44C00176G0008 [uncultured bacterium]|nr:MAG: hypothetical protein ACD_44C00176G0008 [uncultured bacterium]OGT24678.1 MAG: hypothetical protein A2W47_02750 [Gammaproteobacteria bacterium RIFCSPHIGHO2_12_38_15]